MALSSRNQVINLGSIDQTRMGIFQPRNADQLHTDSQLVCQNPRQVCDAFEAVVQSVQIRSAKSNGRGAQTESFENVGSAANAAVDEDLEFAKDGRTYFMQLEEHKERSRRCIEVPPSMVREHDAFASIPRCEHGVLRGLDAFEDDGELRVASEPGDVFPVQGAVNVGSHHPSESAALRVVAGLSARIGRRKRRVGFQAFVRFTFSWNGVVDRKEDGADLRRGGNEGKQLFGLGSITVDVKLEVKRVCGSGGDDVWKGIGSI